MVAIKNPKAMLSKKSLAVFGFFIILCLILNGSKVFGDTDLSVILVKIPETDNIEEPISEESDSVNDSIVLVPAAIFPRVEAPASVKLSAVNLNDISDNGGAASGVISPVRARDARGNKPGWTVTMSVSDFTNEKSDVIPVSNLTVIPGNINAEAGSAVGIIRGPTHQFTSRTDQAVLMNAPKGTGQGIFVQDEMLNLLINVYDSPGEYNAVATITIF